MKVIINYDLVNAIKDIKEPCTPAKVLRNEKDWYMSRMPLFLAMNYAFFGNNIDTLYATGIHFVLAIGSDLLTQKKIGYDTYAAKARKNLKRLPSDLRKINIDTSYDKLLESYMYYQGFRYQAGDDKVIIMEKYIMVPTYNYRREEKETSILEEHVLGSDEYVLSVGTKTKEKRLVRTLA